MLFWQRFVKRTFDVFFSFIALALLWPLILFCIVLARIDTKQSGIFIQKRIGMNANKINVLKIRTMKHREDVAHTTITAKGDARITNQGRIFRKLKFDELPQLWNVLVGDMSFVGPRPDVPGYADGLKGQDRLVLSVRPGITGPATLKYKDEELLLSLVENPENYNDKTIYPDKVQINVGYVNNWSMLADVRYILMTLHLLPLPEELSIDMSKAAESISRSQ